MKKFILSVAMIATVAFVSCSDDESNDPNCKTCSNSGIKYTICDKGNGKASISVSGQTVSEVPYKGNFNDYDFCATKVSTPK